MNPVFIYSLVFNISFNCFCVQVGSWTLIRSLFLPFLCSAVFTQIFFHAVLKSLNIFIIVFFEFCVLRLSQAAFGDHDYGIGGLCLNFYCFHFCVVIWVSGVSCIFLLIKIFYPTEPESQMEL